MPEVLSQDCPLCHKPAHYEFVDGHNRKHFLCERCTEFQISRRVEHRLAESTPVWAEQLSLLAQCAPADHVLVITVPSGPKQDGIANPALLHDYVHRSKLPSGN